MDEILVFSAHYSNRFQYVLDWFFKGVFSYRLTSNFEDVLCYNGPTIVYGNMFNAQNSLCIPDSGYLWESALCATLPENAQISFPIENLNKDIFSFIFFSLARCEEYFSKDLDAWGRFKPENSLAYKNNYLDIPHTDLVKQKLFEKLSLLWPNLYIPNPTFNRQITYDIDVAWAYLHRSFPRHLYGIFRDFVKMDYASIKLRWQVITNKKQDPFFSFSKILKLHDALGDSPIFFCLMGNKSKVDRAVGLKSFAYKQLVKDLSNKYILGLHPSMLSRLSFKELVSESNHLAELTNKKIIHSRQHYLILDFPKTYQNLIKIGIKHDYSMGYASLSGFRAGTCFPYLWFDCQKDECTNLTIHPFQAMDVTFWVYEKSAANEILSKLSFIEEQCKMVGGTFTFIAHNSSFSGPGTWNEWEGIFNKFLKKEYYDYRIS